MPAVGAPRGGNKFAHPAPPPHPHPPAAPRPVRLPQNPRARVGAAHIANEVRSYHSYTAPRSTPSYRDVGQAPHTHTAGGRGTVSQTPHQYRAAVRDVFLHQNAQGRAAILRGLAHGGETFSNEGRAIHEAYASLPFNDKASVQRALGSFSRVGDLGKIADTGLAATANTLSSLSSHQLNPEANMQLGGATPRGVSQVLTHAPIDIARAGLQSPGVIPKTAAGFGDQVAGAVAGGVELPIKMVTEGPGKALSQMGHSLVADYKRRYGPLASGNDKAFINRIKKEGAAPELFDAFMAAGGADATAGRAIKALADTKKALTGSENFFTRERPDLLLSGGKVRSQTVADTAGRIAAQRLEDKLRTMRGKHGELAPNDKQVAPIFQTHAIRVTHSGIAQRWRRAIQEMQLREVRGRRSSALTAISKLNHWQKRALYHTIHGVRVDTAEHLRADLADRRAAILEDRKNPGSLGNRIPAQHADKVDELRLIDQLMAHADKIAGPKMVAFQRGEAERAIRIEKMTNLHSATAEARRLRATGDRLGVTHPDMATAHLEGEAKAAYEAQRTQHLARYVARVRAGMKEKGLPEPGYFRHQESPGTKYGDFASGAGARAMAADKRSTFALHRAGVADHSTQAYIQGLARSIKRPLQWRLTDEQFRAAAIPTVSRAEIKAALGHNKAPHLLTGHDLRRVLEYKGVDLSKVRLYNPGRLAERTLADHGLLPKARALKNPHEDQVSEELAQGLHQDDVSQQADRATDKFLTTQGLKAIPATAFDEIHAGLKGSSLGGRVVGKIQGAQAGAILGANPHFVIMNTLAHAIPAIAATKGALLADAAKFPFWWHGLTNEQRDAMRMFAGGRGGHYSATARLGSQAPNAIAAFGRRLDEHGLARFAKSLNPLHGLLKAEDIQSNFFRHAVMYHEVKRAAFQDMSHEFGRAVTAWEQVKHIFTLGPEKRMKATLENMPKMEELGRTTINILGDYGRFTARERQFFNNRAVMFYSFLRHVTRTLLYVLPARHPLAFGLMGELGNLHDEEVRKILGGQNLPWAYGRIFFDDKGKLRSIDMTSTSPISSPLIDVLSGGVKDLPRLITPAAAAGLDVAYGQTPMGQPIKQNLWSLANDLFSLSYPYRMAAASHFGLKPQQSDSVPLLHERPQVYKTAKAQAYQAAKTKARGPLHDYLLGSALGLYPKPDDSRVIAQHMAQRAAAKGRKRGAANFWSDPGASSSYWKAP